MLLTKRYNLVKRSSNDQQSLLSYAISNTLRNAFCIRSLFGIIISVNNAGYELASGYSHLLIFFYFPLFHLFDTVALNFVSMYKLIAI